MSEPAIPSAHSFPCQAAAILTALADPAILTVLTDPAILTALADPAILTVLTDPVVLTALTDPATLTALTVLADPAVRMIPTVKNIQTSTAGSSFEKKAPPWIMLCRKRLRSGFRRACRNLPSGGLPQKK
jgi:hypothetical protein